MTLSQVVTEIVLERVRLGIREHGGNNRGPEVDGYARRLGLDPAGAYAWCTSGMYDAFCVGAERLGVANPFPATAKAVHVWQALYQRCGRSDPGPGFVYVLDHGQAWKLQRYTDDGHLGIVTALDADGGVADEVSGNTNAAGSREGNCWAIHHGSPEDSHGGVLLGYLDLDSLVAPLVA